ncbi:MAG: hypothetical protein ACR2LC_02105 [Pyrinomonadaceae bacterium]
MNRKTGLPMPALLFCAGLIFVFAAATKIVCAQERLQPPQTVTQTPVAAAAPPNAAAPTLRIHQTLSTNSLSPSSTFLLLQLRRTATHESAPTAFLQPADIRCV